MPAQACAIKRCVVCLVPDSKLIEATASASERACAATVKSGRLVTLSGVMLLWWLLLLLLQGQLAVKPFYHVPSACSHIVSGSVILLEDAITLPSDLLP